MARKLRAGVAGAGVFGGYHARKYAESTQADLAAIFDIDIGRAMERAAEYGVRAHDDFAAFLSQVDVLTVATPATTHGTLAKEAVAAGKHVLVEKPIALELSAADAIVKAAHEGGTVLQVGHQERYVAGAFGLLDRAAPQALRSRRLNKFSPRAGDVSVVMDLMIHDLDLLAELTGLDEITIVNVDQRREKSDFADFVDVTVKAGDTEARLIASRLEEDPIRDLQLQYPDGILHLDFLKRQVSNTTGVPVAADFSSAEPPMALRDPLAFGTESFLQAVIKGTPPPVTGQAGRRALAMALSIEAALNG